MKEYLKEATEVLAEQRSSMQGLTQADASVRLRETGTNQLEEGKKETLFRQFLKELTDPMIIILIVAAVVSGVTAAYSGESFADVIIIMAVVVINAVLGVFQQNKAEKAIEALRKITAATSKVLRDGKQITVKSEELVPGDVVLLEAGDAVPADARILESASMKTEEAALTGESLPVGKIVSLLSLEQKKEIPLGDRKNMVYMGSTVVYGRGCAVITATGMNTEMGKIANALTNAKEEETPLQKRLNQLSRILSWIVIGICAFMFVFDFLRSSDKNILDTFMIAVSLAVAAIPEGLAAVVTVVLSIGVTNMSRKSAVIRRLTAVETLGCTQIICSDKTGTLTQNKMTVTEHAGKDIPLTALAMSLCSDAKREDQTGITVGEPTECALVDDAVSLHLTEREQEYVRIGEAPFDSSRKMMSVVCRKDGEIVQFTKGAPDEVLKRCTHYWDGTEAIPMTEKQRAEILAENKEMADRALRILCAAVRKWNGSPDSLDASELEQNLCYIGLSGMIDPIRPEVKAAIAECKTAGIRPIMITGDHKDTAVAIAKQLGILEEGQEAVTGSQLNELSDEELSERIERYSVYARVQPEHKVRIVKAWQAAGKITAMTGDGVNDAPSIKTADIGVGMGITGTDVTKNVADMVLADDNFATIVSAVEEGRRIYGNIRKSIQFLLSSNLAEVLAIFLSTLMGFSILQPVHLLWINLITDCFPALALGMERSGANLMQSKPRNADDGIFAGKMGFDVVFQGIMITALTLASYFIGHYMEAGVWEMTDSADGTTMAFLTLSLVEIVHSFNMRSRRDSVFEIKKQNGFLWGAAIASLLCTTLVIYVPFLAKSFGFERIDSAEYAVALVLALLILPLIELTKAIQRKLER